MKISLLLEKTNVVEKYNIINEREIATLALANAKTNLKFCTFLDNQKYIDDLSENAQMIFTNKELADRLMKLNKGVCVVENPRITFFMLHNALQNSSFYRRECFETKIGKDCSISESSIISKNNVIIGDNVIIEEFVAVKENTVIKNNCTIRAGTIIGGEGFEHKRLDDEIISVKHLGGVILEEGVELQQSNCVDKAIYPWDDTIVGEKTKTDNFVHIAHADKLGKRVFIAACTCLAGRVETGDNVWIGPGVTIINGISIGHNAKVSIGSVVSKSVGDDEHVTGNFAIEHKNFMRFLKELAGGK
ncbi:MAG: UDP-3-O-(3-hydroxymyristoyl)glucosamine N-acyltransferase [Clostridiales bacterium]|nr:UDP-3-O-(3-hydroxymyristoyl)glucosamine N-acyltransferase [Clostridiales bacterium]